MCEFLDFNDFKTLLRTTKLHIHESGEIVLKKSEDSHNEYGVPLYLIMEQTTLEIKNNFLSLFLQKSITIDKNLDLQNLLKGLQHWFPFINTYNLTDYGSYLEYFEKETQQKEKIEKIILSKYIQTKQHIHFTKRLSELLLLTKEEREKNKTKQDYYNINNNLSIRLSYTNEQGENFIFGTDPCIDVNSFKNAKIVLSEYGKFITEEDMVNTHSITVFEEEDYPNAKDKKHFFFKTKNLFVLNDLLEAISNLLYFTRPLTQEKQQENFRDFVDNYKEIINNNELNENRKPEHIILFDSIEKKANLIKSKNKH